MHHRFMDYDAFTCIMVQLSKGFFLPEPEHLHFAIPHAMHAMCSDLPQPPASSWPTAFVLCCWIFHKGVDVPQWKSGRGLLP